MSVYTHVHLCTYVCMIDLEKGKCTGKTGGGSIGTETLVPSIISSKDKI